MTEDLWQVFRDLMTSPNPDAEDGRLLALAGVLREPGHQVDRELQLLVTVLGSLALQAGSGAEVAGHLAEAEAVAGRVQTSPDRDLAYFMLTEVALRTGHPEVAMRCAPQVTEQGLAGISLQSLHHEAQYYRLQAEAGISDPVMQATLKEAQEAARVDPELIEAFDSGHP